MVSKRISFPARLGICLLVPALASAAETAARDRASLSADAVPLEELVREALERNPEVQAARRAVEAKRARISQARAWPDPKISVSYGGNLLPPFTLMGADPSSARQISGEQEIPYPGKTRLRAEIAGREADAESLAYEAVRRRVAAEVKQTYFDLYFADQSLSTLRKDHELLEKFEKIAENRYGVGQAAQQDVLKAQVELSKLIERRTLLEQTRRALEARLNSFRDRPVDTALATPAEIQPNVLTYPLDDLVAAAQATFPVLKRQRAFVESGRLSLGLAQREVRPNFMLGYTYMQRTGLPDMYGMTFSTTLPIFRRTKQDQAIAEAAASLESARRLEANELVLLRYRLKQEFLEVQATDRLMELFARGIVPQSSLALESSLATYEVGKTDFLTVLSNFTTVLDYELAYHQQMVNRQKALARLEELTGLDLIR